MPKAKPDKLVLWYNRGFFAIDSNFATRSKILGKFLINLYNVDVCKSNIEIEGIILYLINRN